MIPPRSILAAVDFSDASRTALALAARFARQCGAALHVLHAEDPLLSAAAHHAGIDLGRETDEELQRFITTAWPAAECSPQRHAVTGGAVDVVLDTARRVRAQVVVVGSRGMSGAERLVFGSTTEGVLRRAAVSVLVAPAEWAPPRPDAPDLSGVGPVVAAVDLSDDPSVAGAKAACALASLLGTSVELVHVVPDLTVLSRWRAHADAVVRDRVAAAQQELNLLAASLGCSVPVTVRVEAGAVPNRLAEAVAPGHDRAPVLVLGRKAPRAGAAPGATAYRVLSLANVPVLMHVANRRSRV